MRVLVGTSGYQYKEWKGVFYPVGIKERDMLSAYADRLPTVEINNTFYRMPRPEVVAAWRTRVPDTFLFALKAPQRITHQLQLKEAEEALGYFFAAATTLGPRLGAVLFQLPPYLRKDLPRLKAFLALLPPALAVAIEFRHRSWYDDDVYGELSARNVALCTGEFDDADKTGPAVATTAWGYLRLRREDYTANDLDVWAERIMTQPWRHAYVYFKHEVKGPEFAATLLAQCAARGSEALN